mgnify:CR=1 FL=1
MIPLQKLTAFAELIHAFQQVERIARRPHSPRFENDTEHSYQLAMVAWYLAEANQLPFSREKLLSYALAHDLVEVYAGDTYVFADAAAQASKESREADALERIRVEFPESPSIVSTIKDYERREDPESRFIYALDKFLPVLQIYLEQGKLFHEKGVGLEATLALKDPKISISPEMLPLWEELRTLLINEQDTLFPKV